MVDFSFSHADGRVERVRKRAPVQTRRGAEQFERILREEMLNPSPVDEEQEEVPTFREFAAEFLATYARTNNKPSERRSKESKIRVYLEPAFGRRRLDQIKVRDIERFKAKLFAKDLSPKTARNVLAVLSKILRYAEEVELIDKAPRVRLPRCPPSPFDFLTFEEADRLLRAADEDWYAMVFTGLRTGLRFGELSELRWGDVDLVAGRVLVSRSYVDGHVSTPKSGRAREVPLSLETVRVLERHRHLKKLVFCREDGSRITHRVAYAALHRICRRAQLRPIGWHTLRHSFASHLVMRGRSIKEVQELLGHADGNITQTLRYAHLAPNVKRDAVAALDRGPTVQPDGTILAPRGGGAS